MRRRGTPTVEPRPAKTSVTFEDETVEHVVNDPNNNNKDSNDQDKNKDDDDDDDDNDLSLQSLVQTMSQRASTLGAPFDQLTRSIRVDTSSLQPDQKLQLKVEPAIRRSRAAWLRSQKRWSIQRPQLSILRRPSDFVPRRSIRPLQEFPLVYHARVVARQAVRLLSFLCYGTPKWMAKSVRLLCFVAALLPAFVVFMSHYVWFSDRRAVAYVTDPTRRTSRHFLDVYGSTTTRNGQTRNISSSATIDKVHSQLKPVLIFFTGGAWIIGYKAWGTLLARALVPFGILVVIPDYRNFPGTNIHGMVDDADWAVDWTLKNIDKYGGDPNKVVIAGQSAGAHIGACLLLRKSQMEAPPLVQREKELNDTVGDDDTKTTTTTTTTCWHALDIKGFIAVSGPHDLVEMQDIFHQHGLDRSIVSAMFCQNVALHSPTVIVKELSANDVRRKCVQRHFPPTCIIHGQKDKTVPFEISLKFFEALKALNMQQPLEFKLYPSWSHTDPILEAPFAGNHLFHRDVYELVKVWTATSLSDIQDDEEEEDEGDDEQQETDSGGEHYLLPFDENHPSCRKICPLFLVKIARFCNPF